ncbi:MAG TPA: MCE family protein [Nocardia sp.]|uniref:MCE family protein n=1 Tax=Nocardia TaxID=1817 RepID=UPI002457DAA9|nr:MULTISPECIES: MCE family protein [Nocardia]HLS77437.1 MCE family protein [Nocardia sp.]
MPIAFETDGRGHSDTSLLFRGIAFLAVVAALAAWMVAEFNGDLSDSVRVTGLMTEIGDGLPENSDVKFRGVLVGSVRGVTPSSGEGQPNRVHIDIDPEHAAGIPQTVTARVVPSNVFAVSSVQLVDNGPGPAIHDGFAIPEDTGLATVQFQTALTQMREIIAAMSRSGTDDTVGLIGALAQATDRKGADLVRAGAQLETIVTRLDQVMAPDGGPTTVGSLVGAVRGLEQSAPELLDALHQAVVPMRTVAEKREQLNAFLAAGLTTTGTMATAFENNTDRMIRISTSLTPVIGVLADNSEHFVPITTRLAVTAQKFFDHVYHADVGLVQSKMILSLAPATPYTRADCPRYGDLAGPSCFTAPTTAPEQSMPPGLDPANLILPEGYAPPAGFMGGNVGPVGSPQEFAQLGEILGEPVSSAAAILLGPLLRGAVVTIGPAPEETTPVPQGQEAGR